MCTVLSARRFNYHSELPTATRAQVNEQSHGEQSAETRTIAD